MRLCILVRVLLTCIELEDCEFGTCCVGTIGDEIATEQVLLSDRLWQTLLTTSLEVVQAIIYDRFLEAGI